MTASPSEVPPIASQRHTAILAAMFLVLAIGGAFLRKDAAASPSGPHLTLVPLYASLIAAEWGLVYYVWRGAIRHRIGFLAFIGGRWARPADAIIDVLLAVGLWGGWGALNDAWQQVVAAPSGSPVQSMLPVTRPEMLAWIVLAVSAGISEELAFRGYFQRQLRAMTGSAAAALGLQAVLFGVSHFYQGLGPCLRITAYGLLFGVLAEWRKSLRPGIIAHAWTDIVAGLFS